MNPKFFIGILFLAMFQACAQKTKLQGTQNVSVERFAKEIHEKNIQLIDVRTPQEYEGGHIEGALLIDFMSPDFMSKVSTSLDPKKPVYLYCKSGGRSARAMQQLSKAGFVSVTNLEGGYDAWKKKQ